jgi:hypothetical protein
MSIKLTKLTDSEYHTTGNELQNNLIEEDINLLLEEYDEVNDMSELKPSDHVRYFTIKYKKNGYVDKKFRMGGQIIKIDHELKYLVLTAKKLTWSVQFNNTIFYKKMTTNDIKEFYELELDDKDMKIEKLKNSIKKYKENQQKLLDENAKLFNELKNIKLLVKKSGLI